MRWAEALVWGPRRAKGWGDLGGLFPIFTMGNMRWVADSEMFPIRMRKLDNISVRQTYRWKAQFMGFLVIYSVSRSKLEFMIN